MIVTTVVAVVLTVLLFIMIMVIMVLLLRFYGKQCYSARAKQKEYAKTLIMIIIIIHVVFFLQYREATSVPATEGDRATKEEVHEVADSGYVNDPKGYVNVEHPDFTPLSTTGDERSSSIYVEVHSRY